MARARLQRTRPAGAGWVPAPPGRPAGAATAGAVPGAHRAALAERVPVGLRAAVLAPAPRALLGLAFVAGLGVLLGLVFLWLSRPVSTPAPTVRRSIPPAPPVSAVSTVARLVVHVVGAVRRPGLVELATGARVADALAAAGGATRDAELASVNLARPVADGEQLVVLAKGQAPPAGTAGTAAGDSAAGVLDLNTATVEQLQDLPGVGPVLAQRIVDWRTEHGRFSSVDELREVSGIGDRKFADLRSKVRV